MRVMSKLCSWSCDTRFEIQINRRNFFEIEIFDGFAQIQILESDKVKNDQPFATSWTSWKVWDSSNCIAVYM